MEGELPKDEMELGERGEGLVTAVMVSRLSTTPSMREGGEGG